MPALCESNLKEESYWPFKREPEFTASVMGLVSLAVVQSSTFTQTEHRLAAVKIRTRVEKAFHSTTEPITECGYGCVCVCVSVHMFKQECS